MYISSSRSPLLESTFWAKMWPISPPPAVSSFGTQLDKNATVVSSPAISKMQFVLSLFSTSQVSSSIFRYSNGNTGPETLENLQSWIDLFRDNRGDRTVMALCGNKSDLGKSFLCYVGNTTRKSFQKSRKNTKWDTTKHQPWTEVTSKTCFSGSSMTLSWCSRRGERNCKKTTSSCLLWPLNSWSQKDIQLRQTKARASAKSLGWSWSRNRCGEGYAVTCNETECWFPFLFIIQEKVSSLRVIFIRIEKLLEKWWKSCNSTLK